MVLTRMKFNGRLCSTPESGGIGFRNGQDEEDIQKDDMHEIIRNMALS